MKIIINKSINLHLKDGDNKIKNLRNFSIFIISSLENTLLLSNIHN